MVKPKLKTLLYFYPLIMYKLKIIIKTHFAHKKGVYQNNVLIKRKARR